jgi:hypothetical protein
MMEDVRRLKVTMEHLGGRIGGFIQDLQKTLLYSPGLSKIGGLMRRNAALDFRAAGQ